MKRCTRCIMDDSSDKTISFDENGQCNYCTNAYKNMPEIYFPNDPSKLEKLLSKIKRDGKGKPYDCILGISGGLDSSYLTYLAYTWGLRALLVHIDDGYDTDISSRNISKLVEKTGFDYEVIKPDAQQYNTLVLAYMKAGVANLDVPQDNILFAYLYDCMKKYHIKYFLSGGNFSTESILQKGELYSPFDVTNIMDIWSKYGNGSLNKLKFLTSVQKERDVYIHGIKSVRPLNYVEYTRQKAFKELGEFSGFEYYGRKHLENILTAFIQLYWFPKKFGVDKRTSHLSSLIVSGQLTREEAIKEYEEPIYDERMMESYIVLIKERLGLTDQQFDDIMATPIHSHEEFRCEKDLLSYRLEHSFWRFLSMGKAAIRKTYRTFARSEGRK